MDGIQQVLPETEVVTALPEGTPKFPDDVAGGAETPQTTPNGTAATQGEAETAQASEVIATEVADYDCGECFTELRQELARAEEKIGQLEGAVAENADLNAALQKRIEELRNAKAALPVFSVGAERDRERESSVLDIFRKK